ncbi:MAG: DUF5689 domain-containing protein [Balneolaceae bacterium]
MTNFYTQSIFGKIAKYLGGSFLMLAMVFAASLNIQGQTIFEEGLRADTMPDGWAATDVTFTTSAGGYARFTGGSGVLTSPSFDLSGVTGATLSYAVAQYGSGDSGPITIEISTDGGTTWDAQLDTTGTPTSSTYLAEEVTLDAAVYGQSDVMIRFSSSESVSDKRLRDILVVGPDGESIPEAIEVATIADLRAGTADGEARYKLTGEAVMSFYDSYQNRRYLTDGSASIFSIDPNGNLDSNADTIGVGITGLTGTLSVENAGALIQFTLDSESEDATITSTENELTPEVITLADLSLDDTGKLITVEGVTFQETGTFSTGTNYTIEDGDGNTLTFRTDFFNADYIGETIPEEALDITGVVGGYASSPQMFARSSADMVPSAIVSAEPVTVTFRVNTSTIPDTLGEDGFVQIRGELKATLDSASYGAQSVTWDEASTPVADNAGGDYWTVDVTMAPGDTLVYKYWVGLDEATGAAPNGGWEAGDNYIYTVPDGTSEDQMLDLVYYNVGNGRVAPFATEEDSITVYLRVNVGFQVQEESFNPETDEIGVRGDPIFFSADYGWDASALFLEEEFVSGNNHMYSGAYRIHKDSAAAILGESVGYKYKFAPGGDDSSDQGWESRGNRFFDVPTTDTTIHFGYYNDKKPVEGEVDVIDTNLNFEVNVGILEGLGYFNSSIDTVAVTGTFNDWANLDNRMSFNSFSGTYESSTIPLTAAVGSDVAYKYYIRWDASRDDEDSPNYFPLISANDDGWEEPGITGGGNRIFVIEDAENQPTQSEFFNSVPPEGLITESNTEGGALTVTFRVNMEPATSTDLARPFDPANDSVFISVETPFFALTNDLPTYSDEIATYSPELLERLMFTDEDGDMIYELDFELTMPTLNHMGFNIVFGEPTAADGEIVQAGPGGTEPGRRYYQYVVPNIAQVGEDYIITWPSTFTFPVLDWEPSEALPFELPPDYTKVNVSNEVKGDAPAAFSLAQNYPNPFNPTTNIRFALAQSVDVNLTVYNLLGQKVKTLIGNKRMNAGSHTVAFDASSLSSGVYFYRLEAGSFVSNKRMTLIK